MIDFSNPYLTRLSVIDTDGGSVRHIRKRSDEDYTDFGEAYFSNIDFKAVKAWKKHNFMTCNLVVASGLVKFVVINKQGDFYDFILGSDNYQRLTIPPGNWFGFSGLSKATSVVLNIADIPHDPDESNKADIHKFKYDWDTYK